MSDNYAYLLIDPVTKKTACVDPAEPEKVGVCCRTPLACVAYRKLPRITPPWTEFWSSQLHDEEDAKIERYVVGMLSTRRLLKPAIFCNVFAAE